MKTFPKTGFSSASALATSTGGNKRKAIASPTILQRLDAVEKDISKKAKTIKAAEKAVKEKKEPVKRGKAAAKGAKAKGRGKKDTEESEASLKFTRLRKCTQTASGSASLSDSCGRCT
jgi:HEAT repeat protein